MPMSTDSLHTRADHTEGLALVCITCESITEREARIVTDEVLGHASAANHRVALDMEPVHMLASAGIGAVISIHKECAGAGGRMVVFNLNPQLLEVLKLTRLDKLFTIAKSRDAAFKALKK